MLSPEATLLGRERSIHSPARRVARPQWCKANLKTRHANARLSTPEEVALLGTMSDRKVAKQLGCSVNAVGVARRARGIAAFNSKLWETRCQGGSSHLIALDPSKMLARRIQLNLPQKIVAQRTGRPSYYIKLEEGQSGRVSPATLERLAQAPECAPDDLRMRM